MGPAGPDGPENEAQIVDYDARVFFYYEQSRPYVSGGYDYVSATVKVTTTGGVDVSGNSKYAYGYMFLYSPRFSLKTGQACDIVVDAVISTSSGYTTYISDSYLVSDAFGNSRNHRCYVSLEIYDPLNGITKGWFGPVVYDNTPSQVKNVHLHFSKVIP